MSDVTSADGTSISYDRAAGGPPVILVLGAFNERAAGAPLAAHLAGSLTVLNYDRRGRGTSGDTVPYAVDREVDDLGALIGAAGGIASVFGYSSGAVLALRAAARGLPIARLALYDPPFQIQGTSPDYWTDLARQIDDLVAAGRRGDAVALYQTEGVQLPPEVVTQLRQAPFWPALEAIAHTLAYESRVLACPPEVLRSVTATTLVIRGEASPDLVRAAALQVSDGLPMPGCARCRARLTTWCRASLGRCSSSSTQTEALTEPHRRGARLRGTANNWRFPDGQRLAFRRIPCADGRKSGRLTFAPRRLTRDVTQIISRPRCHEHRRRPWTQPPAGRSVAPGRLEPGPLGADPDNGRRARC
jgi:hypothetical protein